MISVVCGVCLGPLLNQGKQGRKVGENQGKVRENDFSDLAATLELYCIVLYCIVLYCIVLFEYTFMYMYIFMYVCMCLW